jgi:hypothetical protein
MSREATRTRFPIGSIWFKINPSGAMLAIDCFLVNPGNAHDLLP